jgi:DNA processing protein
MDYRLLLLMHVPLGLKVDRADLDRLLRPETDFLSQPAVTNALVSFEARAFLAKNPHWAEASYKVLKRSENRGVRWICEGHQDYPEQWLSLSTRPAVFSYKGEPVWKSTPLLSVVGSRTPCSEILNWLQRELPEFLNARPSAIVSGGARGIDQWSHRIALDSGKPTVCILPSGLLNPYPFGREDFWRRIVQQGGCMLSTCGLDAPMSKTFFHIRNRWIAGLSELCFVAEANRRSGSMLTARLALDENKTVCTLPVFPTATQGLGNLDLISAGGFFIRDHRDLNALWDAALFASKVFSPGSGPTALQDLEREGQEKSVDQP